MNDSNMPELTDEMRKRIALEESLKKLNGPIFSKKAFFPLGGMTLLGYVFFSYTLRDQIFENPTILLWIALGSVGYVILVFLMQIPLRAFWRSKLERDLATGISLRSEQLQEKLDESFFTNLVKINFKYIDKYYLQTQVQANKSFALSAVAACVSLAIIIAGIIILLARPQQTEPGYLAAIAGILGEFIAAVFFYLYNSTIVKMGEYHEKLVLTQNIGLALRIAEDLPLPEKTSAQVQLVERLCQNINQYLTGTMPRDLPR